MNDLAKKGVKRARPKDSAARIRRMKHSGLSWGFELDVELADILPDIETMRKELHARDAKLSLEEQEYLRENKEAYMREHYPEE